MISRPCLGCGELIPAATYCRDCQPDPGPRDHVAWANNAQWKNLSKRLRSTQPWCDFCPATTNLTVDHILPVSDYPELTYSTENCRVLCRSCNSQRGNTYTQDEAHDVLTRLQSAYKRRPTRRGRERVAVAQRAIQTQGGGTRGRTAPTAGKPWGRMNLTGVDS